MSEWDEYANYEQAPSQEPSDLIKDLRKQIKDTKDELKATHEKLEERNRIVRERTIADTLRAQGVPEKVAKLIPDSIDPTESAIQQWMTEFRDLFPGENGTTDASQQTEPEGESASPVGDEAAQSMQRMGQSAAGGTPPGNWVQEELNFLRSDTLTHDQLLAKLAASQKR